MEIEVEKGGKGKKRNGKKKKKSWKRKNYSARAIGQNSSRFHLCSYWSKQILILGAWGFAYATNAFWVVGRGRWRWRWRKGKVGKQKDSGRSQLKLAGRSYKSYDIYKSLKKVTNILRCTNKILKSLQPTITRSSRVQSDSGQFRRNFIQPQIYHVKKLSLSPSLFLSSVCPRVVD